MRDETSTTRRFDGACGSSPALLPHAHELARQKSASAHCEVRNAADLKAIVANTHGSVGGC